MSRRIAVCSKTSTWGAADRAALQGTCLAWFPCRMQPNPTSAYNGRPPALSTHSAACCALAVICASPGPPLNPPPEKAHIQGAQHTSALQICGRVVARRARRARGSSSDGRSRRCGCRRLGRCQAGRRLSGLCNRAVQHILLNGRKGLPAGRRGGQRQCSVNRARRFARASTMTRH